MLTPCQGKKSKVLTGVVLALTQNLLFFSALVPYLLYYCMIKQK